MKKKLLITGFDPFGGESVNPAYEAVRLLPDVVAGIKLCKLEVPTEFVRSGAVLRDALAAERPDAVLCVGQAGGRAAITPERVAINLMDARIPDNAGVQPVDQPVVPGGPAAYFATLPVRRMAEAIEKAGLPAQISNTAGTYVCNCVLYHALHLLKTEGRKGQAAFIHVSFETAQVEKRPEMPSMPLETMVRALEAALQVLR